ncbi:MAG TPA: chromate efflux transporter [Burkholderiales bacterium]|nr:chromate efflux transporter [Burkholderiales bacterium]
MTSKHQDSTQERRASVFGVFIAFLRMGLVSFGGPIAHIGYFRDEFVVRRRWLGEKAYADLIALCQFLPGPASSQVGIALGLSQSGIAGGIAAWVGFTLPSAILLALFAAGLQTFGGLDADWLHGLKVVTVAVVAYAVWTMGKQLCPDRPRATLAVLAAIGVLALPGVSGQVAVIVLGAFVGAIWLDANAGDSNARVDFGVTRSAGVVALVLFFLLLILLPGFATGTGLLQVELFDSFFRSGALVFGGGHVVLPLLQAEVVPPGWVDNDQFLAGYGAAQAIPGPLFSFAAYLGTIIDGWRGAVLCLVAIFLPGFLLVIGVLPFWSRLSASTYARSTLAGVNAAVVGLLLAALYDPVITSAIRSTADAALALGAFALLAFWKISPVIVVVATAVASALLRFV